MVNCFQVSTPNLSGSDYMQIKRNKTKYGYVKYNIKNNIPQQIANKPGSINYCLTPNSNVTKGKIISMFDAETRMDIKKGQNYCDPCENNSSLDYTTENGSNTFIKYKKGETYMQDVSLQYSVPSNTSPPLPLVTPPCFSVKQDPPNTLFAIPESNNSLSITSEGGILDTSKHYHHIIDPGPNKQLSTSCKSINSTYIPKWVSNSKNIFSLKQINPGVDSNILKRFSMAPLKPIV